MAVANLQEIILTSIMRKNALTADLITLSNQKRLATYSRADEDSLLNCAKAELRANFSEMFDQDESLQDLYDDYTEIPDYVEQMDILTAQYEEKMNELANWELDIDAQMTTDNTELAEINAYLESFKSMESANIQEDFNYGLNK